MCSVLMKAPFLGFYCYGSLEWTDSTTRFSIDW